MNLSEYTQMEKFEKTFWWHIGRFYLLSRLLNEYLPENSDNELFEIGCGTGETINFLEKYGTVTGLDISPEAIAFCRKKGKENLILGDIIDLDMRKHKNRYDTVLALDVLEHVQDDVEMMKRAGEMLKDDGFFLLTVPAHKFLWSEHDEALHHKRRYHPVELKQRLKDAGLQIEKLSYFVTTAFLPILFIRSWKNIFRKSGYPQTSYIPLPKSLNKFAINVLKVEARVFQLLGLPIGTTLVAIVKKADGKHKK